MATWDTSTAVIEDCSSCGQKYSVRSMKLPCRDNDSATCDCGHTLRSWNDTRMYMYEKIEESQSNE